MTIKKKTPKPKNEREKELRYEGLDINRTKEFRREIREFARKGMFSVFVFTWAQNATPVHQGFLKALQGYCKHRKAKLGVIKGRYKNPTSHFSKSAKNAEVWASEVQPYLIDTNFLLNSNLMVMGKSKIQPTNQNPLSKKKPQSKDKSAIIGHPKIEFTTVATPQSKVRMPKVLVTTGAITMSNYTDSDAGDVGEFHHTIGACAVEIVGSKFFLRQIFAKSDGSFMDLNYEYLPDGTHRKIDRVEALVLGDDHFEFMAENVKRATYGEGGMVEVLKPKYLVHHDGIDFHARSHHNVSDPIIMKKVYDTGNDKVENILKGYAHFIDETTPKDTVNVFTYGNHDRVHLTSWVKKTPPQSDPPNLRFICESLLALDDYARYTDRGVLEDVDPFTFWMKKFLKKDTADKAIFLQPHSDPFIRLGVDMSFHGDRGPNGSRGSLRGYASIGVRTIIAHKHGPGIKDGAMQVGMSTPYNMAYEKGAPSDRLQCHGVLYTNGKRTLLIIVDDGWRAEGFKRKRKRTKRAA